MERPDRGTERSVEVEEEDARAETRLPGLLLRLMFFSFR